MAYISPEDILKFKDPHTLCVYYLCGMTAPSPKKSWSHEDIIEYIKSSCDEPSHGAMVEYVKSHCNEDQQ